MFDVKLFPKIGNPIFSKKRPPKFQKSWRPLFLILSGSLSRTLTDIPLT